MNLQQLNNFKFQFITHYNDKYDYIDSAKIAIEGGCRWIQLRMKDASLDDLRKKALILKELCVQAGATFIIDDQVELCKEIGADGVHLGKNDMRPSEARKLLGEGFIIGGTCNTFEDVLAVKDAVDYIGCGPFRYTTTKKNLAPILGLEGYQNLIWECRSIGINIPIVAIGGIMRSDIPKILKSGPNGIAMSGSILNADNPVNETIKIVETIEKNYI